MEQTKVLMYSPRCGYCIAAVELIKNRRDIEKINIDEIPHDKIPPWLRGVPTLAYLVAKIEIFEGQEVFDELAKPRVSWKNKPETYQSRKEKLKEKYADIPTDKDEAMKVLQPTKVDKVQKQNDYKLDEIAYTNSLRAMQQQDTIV